MKSAMKHILIFAAALGLALPVFAQGVIFAGEEDLKAFDQMVKKSRKTKLARKRLKIKKQMQALTDGEVRSIKDRANENPLRAVGKKGPESGITTGIASEIEPPQGNDRNTVDQNPVGEITKDRKRRRGRRGRRNRD